MWLAILKKYWRVTTFRETPANTPYSLLILLLAILIYFLIVTLQWELMDLKNQFPLSDTMLAAILLVVSYYAYTALLLAATRKSNRILQTLTSLLVCHLIILMVGFIIVFLTPMLAKADMTQVGMRLLVMIYLLKVLVLTLWQFSVAAHIYRQALNSDYLTAILASFGLLAANILTMSFLR
ncbi:hypothetical protein GH742_10750 [Legionella sp. MW5194]|uniref:hypothetical protein n=1 Tax=Legionella sp. MW5194 TaxID=2662448 RepID=UPI00193CC50B|nr:hypothetical protein [Legionella sp. MW5194]QRN04319.1 hypothetical protein GH742_10750 [Legionella sp. MW5194]